jgi:hypothetical protein
MLARFILSAGLILGALSVSYSEMQLAPGDDVTVDQENGAGDGVSDSILIGATDGAQPAKTGANFSLVGAPGSDATENKDPLAGLGQRQEDEWCGWTSLATPIAANDPAWEGNNPSTGSIKFKSCSVLFPGAPGGPGNLEGRPVELQFFPNGVAVAPTPPDPAVLAQQAVGRLRVPTPTIGAGPDRTKLAVNLWTWLWIDNPGPQSVTVAAGGVSVTATATLSSVTWSLGEPGSPGNGYAPGPPVTVTCQGAGTPPPANYDWKAEPPCGHIFHWRSLKERTDGTGTWPITATSTWNVTWASNTGVTGGTTLSATGNDAFDVAEYRIVLVGPGG